MHAARELARLERDARDPAVVRAAGDAVAVLDKAQVANNFSTAADAYDGAASAQDEIAAALVRRLPASFAAGRIVELGSGTGLLSARLLSRFPRATFRGLDIAGGMVGVCRRRFLAEERARFEVADAEDPFACGGPVDLVALSCAAQWFADPEGTLRRWGGMLAPSGLVAAALLVRGSYPELDGAHRVAFGAPFVGLDFPSEDDAGGLLERAGLVPVAIETGSVVASYGSARAALGSFRNIGAVLRGQPGRVILGAARTRRLLAAYEQLCTPGGARVTHRVVWAIARSAR